MKKLSIIFAIILATTAYAKLPKESDKEEFIYNCIDGTLDGTGGMPLTLAKEACECAFYKYINAKNATRMEDVDIAPCMEEIMKLNEINIKEKLL